MKIIQLVGMLRRGDAIGETAMALNNVLIEEGYESYIFSNKIAKGISSPMIKNMSEFHNTAKEDLIIYHMYDGGMGDLIKEQKGKKLAIYHNSTPETFFEEYDPNSYIIQKNARRDIASLHNVFDRCIAVSDFNKADLVKMGYKSNLIDVMPVFINFDDYDKKPDANVMKQYDDDYDNVLFVGRLVPNKKQEDVIRIFCYYHNYINMKSRLFLIGSGYCDAYTEALTQYIEYLGIDDSVIMPGHISFEEIIAYYKCSDVFLCMSEHEGFCVPLIEAMIYDVPIIAYNAAAIPSTLAEAGVLVDNKDPNNISDIIKKIIKDKEYQHSIIEKQKERLERYNPSKVKKEYISTIKSLIE